jgi:hypothetical protein
MAECPENGKKDSLAGAIFAGSSGLAQAAKDARLRCVPRGSREGCPLRASLGTLLDMRLRILNGTNPCNIDAGYCSITWTFWRVGG